MKRLITGPRGSGRTTECIHQANQFNGHLVVRNHGVRNDILGSESYPDLREDGEALTYDDIRKGHHQGLRGPFVIDDVEQFVDYMVGDVVVASSFTPGTIIRTERKDE